MLLGNLGHGLDTPERFKGDLRLEAGTVFLSAAFSGHELPPFPSPPVPNPTLTRGPKNGVHHIEPFPELTVACFRLEVVVNWLLGEQSATFGLLAYQDMQRPQ